MFHKLRSKSINKFEKLSDGHIALYTYDLFSSLTGNDRFINKSSQHGYKVNFIKGNLRLAYKYKIENAVRHEQKATDSDLLSLVSNYLDILNHEEVLESIPLKENVKDYLKNRINNNKIIERSEKRTTNFLYCGPASKWDEIEHDEYDFIIFNKPLINLKLTIPLEKIIIVLNNMWSLNEFKELTYKWGKKNSDVQFFSPNTLGLKNENNNAFKFIPKFFKAGPMALQRTLAIIFNCYDVNSLRVIGADFELSTIRYEKWYPRARLDMKENGFILTNMIHDFLFNILYTKKLKEEVDKKLFGSIDYYLNMPVKEIIGLFDNKVINYRA
jgi:hypothetical protein